MATNSYSNLKGTTGVWNKALRKFGIVTVMNAKIYDVYDGMNMTDYEGLITGNSGHDDPAVQKALKNFYDNIDTKDHKYITQTEVIPSTTPATYTYSVKDVKLDFKDFKANEIIALYLMTNPIATLKYLKTANSTQEGPTKTITGGQNASPLVKYGKTARLEMQDALGNAEALEALTGLTVEYFRTEYAGTVSDIENNENSDVLHATTTFAGHKTIIGDTFIIDANTGAQVPAYVIFYDFLSDSLFNLAQDAEGDATVFDMNGDLIETKILIGDLYKNAAAGTADSTEKGGDENGVVIGTFYTIMPQLDYADNAGVIVDTTNSSASDSTPTGN